MCQADPAIDAQRRIARANYTLDQVASDPVFKEGYEDGRRSRPIAQYKTLYLIGYAEGSIRRPTYLISGDPFPEFS